MPRSKKSKGTQGGKGSAKGSQENGRKPKIDPDIKPAESVQESYEKELEWCLDKVSDLLQNGKLSKEAQTKNLKVHKILSNSKSSFVEKRRAMSTLGDYRSSMAEEEKKFGPSLTKMKVEPAVAEKESSTYFRKAVSSSGNTSVDNEQWTFDLT